MNAPRIDELVARADGERTALVAHLDGVRRLTSTARSARDLLEVVAQHPARAIAAAIAGFLALRRVRRVQGWVTVATVLVPLISRLVTAVRGESRR